MQAVKKAVSREMNDTVLRELGTGRGRAIRCEVERLLTLVCSNELGNHHRFSSGEWQPRDAPSFSPAGFRGRSFDLVSRTVYMRQIRFPLSWRYLDPFIVFIKNGVGQH